MKKRIMLVICAMLWAGCVTGSANAPQADIVSKDGRFVAYDNGTVLDKETGLVWAARDNGGPISWEDAKTYCQNFKAGGHTDWRMPTQEELAALYDPNITTPTPPAKGCKGGCHLTNLIHLTCCPIWYWNGIDEVPGFFNFRTGPKGWKDQSLKTHSPRALPVRKTH
ncbi:MAG: DUF1566 domain-containing protein [Deltaproteobacteria bacterium]|nr:DUF1566 domain-containing protein [Deltaproteobacteria bacterium]